MIQRPEAGWFKALVRRAVPVAAGASMVASASGCWSSSPDQYRRGPVEIRDVMPYDVELSSDDKLRVMEAYKLGKGVPPSLCAELCNGRGQGISVSDRGCEFVEGESRLVCYEEVIYMQPAGRTHGGVADNQRLRAQGLVKRWLARTAWLEESAVYAFAALAAELDAHGAPEVLVRGCLEAMLDEVHHVHLVRSDCAALGVFPDRPETGEQAQARSLVEIALENAVEGCVLETWGALQATWQAEHAQHERLRQTLAVIAEDETRHAALSWDIDRWIRPLLSAQEQEQVAQAQQEAWEKLRRDLASSEGHAPPVELGLPDAHQALTLLDGLSAAA